MTLHAISDHNRCVKNSSFRCHNIDFLELLIDVLGNEFANWITQGFIQAKLSNFDFLFLFLSKANVKKLPISYVLNFVL
jgi:hypothetical protein